jgi:hypothetical protein
MFPCTPLFCADWPENRPGVERKMAIVKNLTPEIVRLFHEVFNFQAIGMLTIKTSAFVKILTQIKVKSRNEVGYNRKKA